MMGGNIRFRAVALLAIARLFEPTEYLSEDQLDLLLATRARPDSTHDRGEAYFKCVGRQIHVEPRKVVAEERDRRDDGTVMR